MRHSGAITLSEDEASLDVFPGHRMSLANGLPAWANMGETVREVSCDIESGETTISFGSSEILGAADMVERLRAARRNTYSYGIQSDRPIEEGLGGIVAGPVSKFSRVGGGAGAVES